MHPSIEFTNQTSRITTETWRFILIDFTLYLDGYKLITGDNVIKSYNRLEYEYKNKLTTIEKENVPLTKVIKQQALVAFTKTIDVDLWNRN